MIREIHRDIAQFEYRGAIVRVERYPRMDTLVEVEGEPAAIEAAIAATGLPRAGFTRRAPAGFRRAVRSADRPARRALRPRAGGRLSLRRRMPDGVRSDPAEFADFALPEFTRALARPRFRQRLGPARARGSVRAAAHGAKAGRAGRQRARERRGVRRRPADARVAGVHRHRLPRRAFRRPGRTCAR